MTNQDLKNTRTKTSSNNVRGLKLAFIAYTSLIILQLFAFYSTNILTMYTQALDRISDVMVSSFLLLSFYWSRKPADKFHMFGHGRAQNVAAVILATVLIFFISAEAFREAIPKLFVNSTVNAIQNVNLAFIVSIIGMFIIAVPMLDILRIKGKEASLKAQGVGILQDEISYSVAIIGIFFASQGYVAADGITSLLIASMITFGGVYLLKDNIHYLVGRAPSSEFFEKLETITKSVNGVLGIHDLKAEYVGLNMIQASLHVEVAKGTPIETANTIAHEVEARVSKVLDCDYCVIHMDPVHDETGEVKTCS